MSLWDSDDRPVLQTIARSEGVDLADLQRMVDGLDPDQIASSVQRLLDGDYIKGTDASSLGGFDLLRIQLTPTGRRAVGQWPGSEADEPFGIVLVPAEVAQLEAVLGQYHLAVDEGELDELAPEARAELEAEMGTLQAQQRSPRPKRRIVREALSSARSILEGAAGSAVYIGVAKLLGMI